MKMASRELVGSERRTVPSSQKLSQHLNQRDVRCQNHSTIVGSLEVFGCFWWRKNEMFSLGSVCLEQPSNF